MNLENFTKEEHDDGSITFTPVRGKATTGVVKCWEDLGEIEGFYHSSGSQVTKTNRLTTSLPDNRNVFATEEQCEASLAFAELSQLMKRANGDWVPNYLNYEKKYAITFFKETPYKNTSPDIRRFLTFKTEAIRNRFLELHIDTINRAKALL